MHPNVSIILSAAILRVKDTLEGRTSVHLKDVLPSPRQIVRLPARIDVSHQNVHPIQMILSYAVCSN